MATKQCEECGIMFEGSNRQKLCSNKCASSRYNKKNKEKNILYSRNYRSKKNIEEIRLKAREYYSRNKETILKKLKLKRMENLKIKSREILRNDMKTNPHLYPKECCICHTKENIEMHHPLYEFELSVYPLCRKHHGEIHRRVC